MTRRHVVDKTDADLLLALTEDPRATAVALAERTGLSRNTVHTRVARLEDDALETFERRIDTGVLGYPLKAFVLTDVEQRKLALVASALRDVPEVIEVSGLSGAVDLLVQVASRDADDLYRVTGLILDIDGVIRTSTALVMRNLVPFRITPLVQRLTRPHHLNGERIESQR